MSDGTHTRTHAHPGTATETAPQHAPAPSETVTRTTIPFRLSDEQAAALSAAHRATTALNAEHTISGEMAGGRDTTEITGQEGAEAGERGWHDTAGAGERGWRDTAAWAGQDTGNIAREPGTIALPDNILTVNLVNSLLGEKKSVPAAMQQWCDQYDFYSATATIGIACAPGSGAKGISKVVFAVALESDNPHAAPQIDDAGPETAWVDGPASVSADVKIDTSFINGLLKFVKIGPVSAGDLPLPTLSWEYKYAQTPKTPSVIAAHGGPAATWTFTKTNAYIDGQFDLLVLLRRPNTQRTLGLRIKTVTATFDYSWFAGGAQEVTLAIDHYIPLEAKPTLPLAAGNAGNTGGT